jgi:hypothetical protein
MSVKRNVTVPAGSWRDTPIIMRHHSQPLDPGLECDVTTGRQALTR